MGDDLIIHKTGWCFTCDTDECVHIQNANQSLINSFSNEDEDDD